MSPSLRAKYHDLRSEYQAFVNQARSLVLKVIPKANTTKYALRRRMYYELTRVRAVLKAGHLEGRRYAWGIDPSYAGTGFCVLDLKDGKTIYLERLSTPPSLPIIMRTDMIVKWLERRFVKFPPVIIMMESTFFDRKTAMSFILSKLNHALEYELMRMGGALFRTVSPVTMKKFIMGKGNVRKKPVQDHIYQSYGHYIESDDMCDAFAFAIMGKEIMRILNKFDLSPYDINDDKSMREFAVALAEFVDDRQNTKKGTKYKRGNTDMNHRYVTLRSVLTAVSYGMDSLLCILPSVKMPKVIRKKPEVLLIGDEIKTPARDLIDSRIELSTHGGNEIVVMEEPDHCFFDEAAFNARTRDR